MKMRHMVTVIGVASLLLGVYAHALVIIPETRVKIAQLEKAMQIYALEHNGKLPPSLDELTQFAYNCYDYGDQPLLKKEDLIDSWGEPILYEHSGRKHFLISSGPDRKMGTADDVYDSWPLSYVESWRAKLAQTADTQGTNAVQGAAADQISPATVKQNPPYQSREEAAKEREQAMQQREKLERSRRLFMRNAKVVGIALTLGICVAAVRARARKKAGRK